MIVFDIRFDVLNLFPVGFMFISHWGYRYQSRLLHLSTTVADTLGQMQLREREEEREIEGNIN